MRPVTGLFVASSFASAFLLFLVQPMIARMALPWFGGGAAVWTTALLFFQALLLGGYAYGHALSTRLAPRRALALHLAVLALPLGLLPPALSSRWAPSPGAWPVPSLLAALAASVGAGFFSLSTNGTLAQRWYALTGAKDPYALYAASNLGSLSALLAYPLLVEPRLDLGAQALAWSSGYALSALLSLGTMAVAWRLAPVSPPREAPREAPPSSPPTPLAQRARWLLRASVTSLLLVAVSQRLASDVASTPLLWVAPLGLYLLGWVLAFTPGLPLPRPLVSLLALYGVTLSMNLWPLTHLTALGLVAAPPLATLLLGSWVVHGDLARDRPPPERLTEFYFHTAAGGFAGGALGGLVAPLAFDSLAEYPLSLLALVLALALDDGRGHTLRGTFARPLSWVGPGLALVALTVAEVALHRGAEPSLLWRSLPLALLALSLALWKVPGLYVGVCALVCLLSASGLHADGRTLATARSFYGVLRVREVSGWRALSHGSTLHGLQRVSPPSDRPGTYYHPSTPMGAAVQHAREGARVAVVGLGTGSLAALTRPGQRLTFFELDPAVRPLAERYFTFLRAGRGRAEIVHGDARQTLALAPEGAFDLLVVDAFSSDAIPLHLLTVEALSLYLSRVKPEGAVLLHVSHRHLDLARVVAGASARLRVPASLWDYTPDASAASEGARSCTVVALARTPAALAALAALPSAAWRPLSVRAPVVWTDARASLLDVLTR